MSLHQPINFTQRGLVGFALIVAGLLLAIGFKKTGVGSESAVRGGSAIGTCLVLAGSAFFSSYMHRWPFAQMRSALLGIGVIGGFVLFRCLFF